MAKRRARPGRNPRAGKETHLIPEAKIMGGFFFRSPPSEKQTILMERNVTQNYSLLQKCPIFFQILVFNPLARN
jgi:hypothetical protein